MIALDLRKHLALVPDDVEAAAPGTPCKYTMPCVIGMMMTPEQRETLRAAQLDEGSIPYLMGDKAQHLGEPPIKVEVPDDQHAEFERLQELFDARQTAALRALVSQLKEKYRGDTPVS